MTLTNEQKDNVRQLIAALRGGYKYKQTTTALSRRVYLNKDGKEYKQPVRKYCCLGVGCEIAIKNGLELTIETQGSYRSYNGSTSYLPVEARDFFGFEHDNPDLLIPPLLRGLITEGHIRDLVRSGHYHQDMSGYHPQNVIGASYLNDKVGFNFGQIADCFEYTYVPEDYAVNHETVPNPE